MKTWDPRPADDPLERRCAPHTPIALRASLRPAGQPSFDTSAIDLSLGGFAAWCRNRLERGSLCWLQYHGLEPLQSEVVWWDDRFVGCAFSDLLAQHVHDSIIESYHG